MATKAELEWDIGDLSLRIAELESERDGLASERDIEVERANALGEQLQQVAQEKADLQSELTKALRVNTALVEAVNLIGREIRIVQRELADLETPQEGQKGP